MQVFLQIVLFQISLQIIGSGRPVLKRQMQFSPPSIKCSAAPPSFRLCWVNWAQRCDLITARSTVVGSSEEPPHIWLTVAKNPFVGWPLNLRVRMLLKGAEKHVKGSAFQNKQIAVWQLASRDFRETDPWAENPGPVSEISLGQTWLIPWIPAASLICRSQVAGRGLQVIVSEKSLRFHSSVGSSKEDFTLVRDITWL